MKTKYFSKTLTKFGITITAIFAVLLVSFSVQAQCPAPTYSGSQIVCVGDVTTYVVTNPVAGATYNWSVSSSYGIILGSGILPPPENYPYVSVRWDNPATGTQAWVRASYTTGPPNNCNVVGNQYYVTVNPLPSAYQFQYSTANHYYTGDNTSTAYYCHEANGVTLSVLGSDLTSPATTYELRRTSDDVTFATVNGTGSAINFTNVTVQNHAADAASSTQYYVVARNPQVCQTSMIGNVVVHKFAKVLPGVIATTTSSNIGACQAIAPAFTSTTAASGGYQSLGYQWQINVDGGGWNDIVGETAATYTHSALTVPGTYQFRRKVTNHCATVNSNVISITVDAIVTANAGSDKTIGICTPSVVINGSGTGTATLTYSWAPATYLSASNIAQPTFNNPGIAGTYDYVLTVTDAYGCTATDGMTVTVDSAPTASVGGPYGVNLDNKIGACAGQQIAINATASGTGIDILWTGSGAAFLSLNNIEDPTFSGASPGTYSMTMTVTDDYGCQASATLTIIVDPLPTVDAGVGGNIGACASAADFQIAASSTGTGVEFLWTGTGSAHLSSTTIEDPTFDGFLAGPGTYTLTLTVTDDYGCTDSDFVVIIVDPLPTVDAGIGGSIGACASAQDFQIAASSNGTGLDFLWSGTGSAHLSSTTIEDPTFDGSAAGPGTYTLTLTVTDDYGCTDSDFVVIIVDAFPTADVGGPYGVNNDNKMGACAGQQIAINATATGTGIDILWTGSGATYLDEDDIEDPIFSGAAVGTYQLIMTVTDTYGCTVSDVFSITVDPAPTAAAGPDGNICVGQTYNITGSASGTGIEILWTGSGVAYLSSTTIATPIFNNTAPAGTYTLTITVTDDYGCIATDDLVVNVYALPVPNAGANAVVCNDVEYTLQAVASPGSSGIWSYTGPGTALFIVGTVTSTTPTVKVNVAGKYTFTWTETSLYCPSGSFPDDVEITFLKGTIADATDIDPIADIYTIAGTPAIIYSKATYGNVSGSDANINVDALIQYDGVGVFPAGATIFKVNYKVNPMPVFVSLPVVNGNIGGLDEFLLSWVLGQVDPLNLYSNRTIEWEIFVDGVSAPMTIPMSINSISYIGTYTSTCYAVLDEEKFDIIGNSATTTLSGTYEGCYPDDDLVVNAEIVYPQINVDSRVKADALLKSDLALNAGASIAVEYNGSPVTTYTLLIPLTQIHLSELLGSTPTPLAGHSGLTDNWVFTISDLNPGTYNITVESLARLDNQVGPPTTYKNYIYDTDNAKLIVVGSLEVSIDPIANIETVTGAPIVVPITVNYGDLSDENIDGSIMADALILFDGTLPATAKIVELKLGATTIATNYSLANADEVLLSDVVVAGGYPAPFPLNTHADGRIDVWTAVFAGIDNPGTYTVTVQGIAYVGTYSPTNVDFCYSVTAEEEFTVTWADLTLSSNTPATVCEGDVVIATFDIVFPNISVDPINPDAVGFDVRVMVDKAIPTGVTVAYNIAGGFITGSFGFPGGLAASTVFYLGDKITGLPYMLNELGNESFPIVLTISGLPALPVGQVYGVSSTPVAVLGGNYYILGASAGGDWDIDIEIYEVPVATISGPASVFSGGTGTYSVAEHLYGSPTYAWSSDAGASVTFGTPGNYTTTVTFVWPFTGEVELTVVVDNGVCSDTKTFDVYVKPNQLVGQVKYYNAAESPMPSPFNTNYNGMTVPDYFWVALHSGNLKNGSFDPYLDALQVVKVQEYYAEDTPTKVGTNNWHKLLTTDEYYEAAFGFTYNLNPDEEYFVVVWDGGYLEENLGDGKLGQAWTWNNWNKNGKAVNATDALLIQHMVVSNQIKDAPYSQSHIGSNLLTPKYGPYAFNVADVNRNSSLTSLDALLTQRRALGLINNFPNGKPNFTVGSIIVDKDDFNTNSTFGSGVLPELFAKNSASYLWSSFAVEHFYYGSVEDLLGEYYMNIYYNSVGDINASYVPAYGGFKVEPGIKLIQEGEMAVKKGDIVEIPVSLETGATLGALSLGLNYRTDLIKVVETNYGEDFAVVNHEDGTIRIAWFNEQGTNFNVNEAIATISVLVLADIEAGTELFELDGFTELADQGANVLNNNLKTIGLSTSKFNTDLSINNYPNPFSTNTTFSYNLPEAGKVSLVVYDKLGQTVGTLVSQVQKAGVHTFEFNNDLKPGAYFYRITLQGANSDYSLTKSMIVVK